MRNKTSLTAASIVLLLTCVLLAGCQSITQVCSPPDKPDAAQQKQLSALWSSLKQQRDRRLLQAGLNFMLDKMLEEKRFHLKKQNNTFVVVEAQQPGHCSSTNSFSHHQQDRTFLKRLYAFVKRYKLQINKYLPSVQRKPHPGLAGCPIPNALVEWTYWKAISGPYTPARWGEACVLGQRMLGWKKCLSGEMEQLIQLRTRKLCQL